MNKEYSLSLFMLGKEENLLDSFYNDVKELIEVFKDKKISLFLDNRFINREEKKKVLNDTLKGIHKYVNNFINVVIDDDKESELAEIFEEFIELYYKEKKITKGKVYGVSLEENKLKELEKVLSEKLSKTVILDFIKDESLIGGYKIIVDNKLYDNSYKRKLENLKNNLLKEGEFDD